MATLFPLGTLWAQEACQGLRPFSVICSRGLMSVARERMQWLGAYFWKALLL